ncbi:class II fumarate hydratase [Pseudonocardia sp. KRD-184]|uniref:Fumarate hydratase class II n=1 Tax=Pseudonocardia oceani TaxID=2792013 RepID=A0ABS6UBQ7_9PSEU|nr:class II fumarate hydratase [Pseudonocardia oceani]MBW0091480.1 class II fumarate hydratase [Pseudonocardia oceani]MBW0098616.1 class II fumarate hydratase [Pseudonocardia oceani]MBW0111164.1 class II fumarate hydratase [Pseudonocardia oceani]MBW0125055.1 class II fumarate hydratase [Pseudonocardia oceani]MBW0129680.1 class II fumarate hydratase [Pseudonocardia oceani]
MVDDDAIENGSSRIEHDTMGEVRVPADALWRAQTQRAVENFPISGRGLERAQIRALGLVKAAAARVNGEIGVLAPELAEAIAAAADEVAAGEHDAHFPVDVFQTGSGTSSNMNANEVIASLAARAGVEVHPNDHVNASQSSNDVFPTTIHLAATEALATDAAPALDHLAAALNRRAAEWVDVVTAGRTHLMDAVPITLGQEAGGWATQAAYGAARIRDALPRLGQLPIGGTAVGTGLNAPAGFGAGVVEQLRAATGLDDLSEAPDHIEAQGARDGLVEASGALRTAAVSLFKIANDIRWLGSGPRTGLAELHLPDLQPGSSIMPGKVNPVICEAAMMVAAQVIGNDATVAFSGTQGNLQLNVMMPVMARNVLESARLLANAARLLADKVVDGMAADVERTRELAESSPAIVTPLNKYLGYEEAASIAKQSLEEKRTIREVVLERGHVESGTLTAAQLDQALDVLAMARGGR